MYAPINQCIIHFDKNKNSGPAAPSSRGVPSPRIFVKWGRSPLPFSVFFVKLFSLLSNLPLWTPRGSQQGSPREKPRKTGQPRKLGPRSCVKWCRAQARVFLSNGVGPVCRSGRFFCQFFVFCRIFRFWPRFFVKWGRGLFDVNLLCFGLNSPFSPAYFCQMGQGRFVSISLVFCRVFACVMSSGKTLVGTFKVNRSPDTRWATKDLYFFEISHALPFCALRISIWLLSSSFLCSMVSYCWDKSRLVFWVYQASIAIGLYRRG